MIAQLKAMSEFSVFDSPELETHMTTRVQELYAALLSSPVDEWKDELPKISWIWTGHALVGLHQVAQTAPPELAPLLVSLPTDTAYAMSRS